MTQRPNEDSLPMWHGLLPFLPSLTDTSAGFFINLWMRNTVRKKEAAMGNVSIFWRRLFTFSPHNFYPRVCSLVSACGIFTVRQSLTRTSWRHHELHMMKSSFTKMQYSSSHHSCPAPIPPPFYYFFYNNKKQNKTTLHRLRLLEISFIFPLLLSLFKIYLLAAFDDIYTKNKAICAVISSLV